MREMPRLLAIDSLLSQNLKRAREVLAEKEWTPHKPEGVDPASLARLHGLPPWTYVHVAMLPLWDLKRITRSPKALAEYVKNTVFSTAKAVARRELPAAKAVISQDAYEYDQRLMANEKQGPRIFAKLQKEHYYHPLNVRYAITSADAALLTLRVLPGVEYRLRDAHIAAAAALPPFSRLFLAKWLEGREEPEKYDYARSKVVETSGYGRQGLVAFEAQVRKETEKLSEQRLQQIKKVIAEGNLLKFVQQLVLGNKSTYASELTSRQREYDESMLNFPNRMRAVQKMYLPLLGNKK